MYQYDAYDRALVFERVAQFRDQVERFIAGDLSEEEFLPLRLQNGLYLQKHAYMLRVAIPYGTLSAEQMRTLASIARDYDRGYGHFTTRQNLQFNWIELHQVPDILERLAQVDMHAIQTSGNCVRNITTEAFAGVAADELLDPRPLAEILRQWSTINPEFLFLPRKFKIAICSAREDRAAIMMHDIGLYLYRDEQGDMLLRVMVGGGLGRTPILGLQIREGLPWRHLLSYVEAVLRVYNRHGRRDNKYKARIKILVKALGIEAFSREVEEEWRYLRDGPAQLTDVEYDRVASAFVPPAYASLSDTSLAYGTELADIIACPGGDFCALANAKSIPIAQAIQQRFDNLDYLHDLGEISLNISGCINACGHHHIGNIGILGVDKNGSEWYQITLGGAQGKHSSLGKVIGPSFR